MPATLPISTSAATRPAGETRPTGEIDCRLVEGNAALVRCCSRAPLKFLTPNPVGRAASVVMSSFGGGLVAGDEVSVVANVQRDAACILSTQSAGKAYRSDGRTSSQSLDATIAEGALLAVLPDPLCCFADARFAQRQTFELSARANLVWLDCFTSGRWARGERWAFRSLQSRTDIRIDGQIVLRETIRLDHTLHTIEDPMRVGGYDCYATLAIVGPQLHAMADAAERLIAALPADRTTTQQLVSCTRLDEHGVIVRVLGQASQSVLHTLRPIVASLADVIGADPWSRKW